MYLGEKKDKRVKTLQMAGWNLVPNRHCIGRSSSSPSRKRDRQIPKKKRRAVLQRHAQTGAER